MSDIDAIVTQLFEAPCSAADEAAAALTAQAAEIGRLRQLERFVFRVLYQVANEEPVDPNDFMAAILHLNEENRAALNKGETA